MSGPTYVVLPVQKPAIAAVQVQKGLTGATGPVAVGASPLSVVGNTMQIADATPTTRGSMPSADKAKIDASLYATITAKTAPQNAVDVNLYIQAGDIDDTAAVNRALAWGASHFVAGWTLFFPNRGTNYVISSTVRIWTDAAGSYNGLHFKGEGGKPSGVPGTTTTIQWAGSIPNGTAAATTTKYSQCVLITGITVPASVLEGDILETWGWADDANNGRFVIVAITSSTSVVIHNTAAIAGKTGSWLIETNMFDIRGADIRVDDGLRFCFGQGKKCTSVLNWTESPIAGSVVSSHFDLKHCALANDRIVSNLGFKPGARWGVTIGSPMCSRTKVGFSLDVDGFPIPQSPSQVDMFVSDEVVYHYLDEAAVFFDGNNGNSYPNFIKGGNMTAMGTGVRISAGHVALKKVNIVAIWDAVLSLSGNLAVRPSMDDCHYEVVGSLVRDTSAQSSGVSVEHGTSFLAGPPVWTDNIGGDFVPAGFNQSGVLIYSGGNVTFEDNTMSPGVGQPMYILAGGGTSERKIAIGKNRLYSSSGSTASGRAAIVGGTRPGPWKLANGDTLTFKHNGGGVQTLTLSSADGPINEAGAHDLGRLYGWQVAYAIHQAIVRAGATGMYPVGFGDSSAIWLYSTDAGSSASIEITGGTLATKLGLAIGTQVGLDQSTANTVSCGLVDVQPGYPVHICMTANQGDDGVGGSFKIDDVDYHTIDASAQSRVAGNAQPGPSNVGYPCRNLGGAVTFGSTDTLKQILFKAQEYDASYTPIIVPGRSYGSVAAGARRAVPSLLTRNGFLITLDAAPGGSASQEWLWMLERGEGTSSDSVDPTIIGAPVLWLDAAWTQTVNASNGVSAITDRSASAANLGSLAGTVLWTPGDSDGPGGCPYWHFNGDGQLTATQAIITGANWTIIAVCRQKPTNQAGLLFDVNDAGLYYTNAPLRSIFYKGATEIDTIGATSGKFEILELSHSSGQEPKMKVNGTLLTNSSSYTAFAQTTNIQIGGTGGFAAHGDLALLLAYNSDLSGSGSMATLRAALNARYHAF